MKTIVSIDTTSITAGPERDEAEELPSDEAAKTARMEPGDNLRTGRRAHQEDFSLRTSDRP